MATENGAIYTPIFCGRLPTGARARWAIIRRFLDAWCLPEGPAWPEPSAGDPLIDAARARCDGVLSHSVECWLALAGHAVDAGTPLIRDSPTVGPIEDHIADGQARGATVVLISGEGDFFWAVPDSRLADDDPPVDVFQRYDRSIPAFVGRDESVSGFALKYLLMYNGFATSGRDRFTAFGAEEDVAPVRGQFTYSLDFGSDDAWCGPIEILEREDMVAIRRGRRWEVTLFGDPTTVALPVLFARERDRQIGLRRGRIAPDV